MCSGGRSSLLLAAVLACACTAAAPPAGAPAGDAAEAAEQAPNPFGLDVQVVEPLGDDVLEFARGVELSGAADDVNAEDWVEPDPVADYESIEGEWASRWFVSDRGWTSGRARIAIEGDRIFIHHEDTGEPAQYLIEAERQDDRLVGRYVNVARPADSSPWVGLVVSNERIDGQWAGGRWDFRRGKPVSGKP